MTFRPILCIDFDGVIHSYEHGWRNGDVYGSAVPGFFRWAIEAAKTFDLVVYSSRSKTADGIRSMQEAIGRWSIDAIANGEVPGDFEWPLLFDKLSFSEVKPPAWLTIDDRAVRFDGDWTMPALQTEALLAFMPWNLR